ncbi:MAG: 50S ribosomal protein L18 [Desulfobacterales bacterium CG23_combo_of_CG06-09_8_20_14_all_51_8]|nr:MAG: 50S ribosomal protein L18 [Desulfobacterales bacterium CG23_combo_of_CG06-09_8_20_14_all_51_8]
MNSTNQRKTLRLKRKKRIRKNLAGTPNRPRMSVFRSARHIYTQIVDDTQGITLVAASTTEKEVREQQKFENKTAAATFIGRLIAERAAQKGIKSVVFDRNGFLYHGRVKAVSDGARKAGLDF